ncbi:hypothetical protein [Streptomyces niveus]
MSGRSAFADVRPVNVRPADIRPVNVRAVQVPFTNRRLDPRFKEA